MVEFNYEQMFVTTNELESVELVCAVGYG